MLLPKLKVKQKARSATLHPSTFATDKHFKAPPERFAFVRLQPKTGRTHQLRVHLAAIGHPMVGDTMYGGRTFEIPGSPQFKFERQALHAAEITFVHPVTLNSMTLTAPLPTDIKLLLDNLRSDVR